MRIPKIYLIFICFFAFGAMAFNLVNEPESEVEALYLTRVLELEKALLEIDSYLASNQLNEQHLGSARMKLKAIDPMLRYLDPISYKLVNGPLLVEWETEVFEKLAGL